MQSTRMTKPENNDCRDLAEVGRSKAEFDVMGDDGLFRALVSGCHIENAALVAGVSQRTVYRRLADPQFRKQIDQARQSLRESILAKLTDAGHDAIGVLVDLMHSSDEASVRLKAAKAVIDSLVSFQRHESAKTDGLSCQDRDASTNVVVYLPDNGRKVREELPVATIAGQADLI